MPGTYSQLLLHVVTSTRQRTPWISADVAERLYPCIGGIVWAENGVLYAIGGVEDHIHMYLRWRPDGAVSDLMRTVKSRSTKWLRQTVPHRIRRPSGADTMTTGLPRVALCSTRGYSPRPLAPGPKCRSRYD